MDSKQGAENQVGCAIPRCCMLASAQLGWLVERQGARLEVGLQSVQHRQCFKEDFICPFTLSKVSNADILMTIFI
jgi:hypothetical protein